MLLLGLVSACGVGVPVQLRLDEITVDLSLDEGMADLSTSLRESGVIPPESPGLPEVWPAELPDVCFEHMLLTDPEEGGRIDLTPDPAEDPEAAEQYEPINDGIIDRIELDRLVVRVEENTLNVALPPIEIQAADTLDASPEDRRAWQTVGVLGGTSLHPGCDKSAAGGGAFALASGDLGDIEFRFRRGGESFLNAQLRDERCLERQTERGDPADPFVCKEFSLRARTRIVLDTAQNRSRPRGAAKLRFILLATFFVTPKI